MYKLKKYYPQGFNPQQYWDDRYSQEHIAGKSSDEYAKQDFWPLIQKYFKKDKQLLDAGCGIGGWIIYLKEQGYDVVGTDVAPRIVKAMIEFDPELEIKMAGITAIPYPDNSFGGVLAVGALEYVEDKVATALTEVHRVLKPGGIFILEVPIINLLRKLLYIPLKETEHILKKKEGKHPSFSNYLFDRTELRKLLLKSGFEIISEIPHELPDANCHYGLYIDWKLLRGNKPYELNPIGKLIKIFANSISPWIASTGTVLVARKIK